MALQTAIAPSHANLIWWTLVHKRRKIGPEFRPTARAAITLGIATHSGRFSSDINAIDVHTTYYYYNNCCQFTGLQKYGYGSMQADGIVIEVAAVSRKSSEDVKCQMEQVNLQHVADTLSSPRRSTETDS